MCLRLTHGLGSVRPSHGDWDQWFRPTPAARGCEPDYPVEYRLYHQQDSSRSSLDTGVGLTAFLHGVRARMNKWQDGDRLKVRVRS